MTLHDDRVYVALIRDAARGAIKTVAGMSREEFLTSETGQAAVALDVVLVVERVPKLSKAFRASHPEMDWEAVASLRSRTEPEFAKIDAEVEWDVATTFLPSIADALDALLPSGAPWHGTGQETGESAGGGASETDAITSPAQAGGSLAIPHKELHELCQRLRVTRLRLFGSALRGDFDPQSDIDMLVEYEPGTKHAWGGAGLGDEFSPLLSGRAVELIDPEYLNPYVRERILAEAVEIYPVDHRNPRKAS